MKKTRLSPDELHQVENQGFNRKYVLIIGAIISAAITLLVVSIIGLGLALRQQIQNNREVLNRLALLETPPPPTHAEIVRASKRALRNCAKDAKCRADFRRLGPIGQPGMTGPRGRAGDDGEAGADGDRGARGPMGSRGATGPAGPAGPIGPMGSRGRPGLPGLPGTDGAEEKINGRLDRIEARLNELGCSIRRILRQPCP